MVFLQTFSNTVQARILDCIPRAPVRCRVPVLRGSLQACFAGMMYC